MIRTSRSRSKTLALALLLLCAYGFGPAEPGARPSPAAPAISLEEAEAISAFFTLPATTQADQPLAFHLVYGARQLAERSKTPEKAPALDWLEGQFPGQDPALFADFRDKNKRPGSLLGRVSVPGLTLMGEEALDEYWGFVPEWPYRQDPLFAPPPVASVSRVGFNTQRDIALFTVTLHYSRRMCSNYMALLHKQQGVWRLAKAVAQSHECSGTGIGGVR